ncbi:RbsD/FucU domain-containing protein [Fulvivirgaceae bacterium BMA12]|uniref:D-ribose pyranase n=1 Tax=Agaribacillus aureus TaxID=3051825 RepID=A0ABT8LF00_9BACT|nr:RbsD/FucU domain-containing protein [Fulvivirgaceae bacterium BMA12]
MYFRNIIILVTIGIFGCSQQKLNSHEVEARQLQKNDWKSQVREKLMSYGHRNWIVVADAAYPMQSNPAIQTMVVDAGQLEAVEFINNSISNLDHVDANIFVDKEIAYVKEKNAKGIENYKEKLDRMLRGKPVESRLHEDIIKELDKAAELFNILILKTDQTIPYTSVFFQLECGYWDAASEKALRNIMENTP